MKLNWEPMMKYVSCDADVLVLEEITFAKYAMFCLFVCFFFFSVIAQFCLVVRFFYFIVVVIIVFSLGVSAVIVMSVLIAVKHIF